VHLDPLDVARLFVGASVLAFASYTDWRWRRAPNVLWWIAGGAGAALLAVQLSTQPDALAMWPLLVVAAVFAGLMFAFFWLGLLAGGADAKALMAIAVLVPLPLHLGMFPLQASPLPPPFAVLGNALVAFLVVPLGLLVRNAARGHVRVPHALVGLRMPTEDARRKHMWPMEHVAEDGRVKTVWMPSRFLWEDEDWEALLKAGRSEIWVTPKVPFMLPLAAGYVAAFLVGDVLFGSALGTLG
jgi:preflagellin peptidase FlaK